MVVIPRVGIRDALHSVMKITENLREKVTQNMGKEGDRTSDVERFTSALPSMTWLVAAGASMAGALALKLAGRDHAAVLVGQWAPTFLIIGLYNKLVKVAGSDRRTATSAFH